MQLFSRLLPIDFLFEPWLWHEILEDYLHRLGIKKDQESQPQINWMILWNFRSDYLAVSQELCSVPPSNQSCRGAEMAENSHFFAFWFPSCEDGVTGVLSVVVYMYLISRHLIDSSITKGRKMKFHTQCLLPLSCIARFCAHSFSMWTLWSFSLLEHFGTIDRCPHWNSMPADTPRAISKWTPLISRVWCLVTFSTFKVKRLKPPLWGKDDFRVSYLRKLAYSQVWVPKAQRQKWKFRVENLRSESNLSNSWNLERRKSPRSIKLSSSSIGMTPFSAHLSWISAIRREKTHRTIQRICLFLFISFCFFSTGFGYLVQESMLSPTIERNLRVKVWAWCGEKTASALGRVGVQGHRSRVQEAPGIGQTNGPESGRCYWLDDLLVGCLFPYFQIIFEI